MKEKILTIKGWKLVVVFSFGWVVRDFFPDSKIIALMLNLILFAWYFVLVYTLYNIVNMKIKGFYLFLTIAISFIIGQVISLFYQAHVAVESVTFTITILFAFVTYFSTVIYITYAFSKVESKVFKSLSYNNLAVNFFLFLLYPVGCYFIASKTKRILSRQFATSDNK